jgi:HEAT repeat protein
VRLRDACLIGLVLLAVGGAPIGVDGQDSQVSAELEQHIANLGALDFPVRMHAARLIRRTPGAEAVPLLAEAARQDPNEFVRYRALVLLTAFNDPGTRRLMEDLIRDRNDRVREVV